jgi:hypothetical protein
VILPVWVAAWEYECCRPDAVVGETWAGSLFLRPPEPWWANGSEAVDPEILVLGVVNLDVEVVRPAPHADAAALVAVDGIRLGVVSVDVSGPTRRVRGRVVFEGHVGPDGVELDEVECRGTVRRVRRVPLVRKCKDGMWVPVSRLAAVDVASTADRHSDGLPPQEPDVTYVTDDLLVDVEVEASV